MDKKFVFTKQLELICELLNRVHHLVFQWDAPSYSNSCALWVGTKTGLQCVETCSDSKLLARVSEVEAAHGQPIYFPVQFQSVNYTTFIPVPRGDTKVLTTPSGKVYKEVQAQQEVLGNSLNNAAWQYLRALGEQHRVGLWWFLTSGDD